MEVKMSFSVPASLFFAMDVRSSSLLSHPNAATIVQVVTEIVRYTRVV